jgi:tetratricopeptide (TPR) repeat protein
VYTFLGGAYFGLGDLARTLEEFHRSLDAYTQAGSSWGIATALGNLAEMHLVLGEEACARDYARRAHLAAEPTGNAYLLTHNAYRLAVLLANAGDHAAARRHQQESLTYAEQLGYQSGVGLATASLGDIAFAMGDFGTAEQHFAAAVDLHRAAGNWMDEARYLVRQGETALAQGQVEQCRSYLHAALRKASHASAAAVQMDALVQVARLRLHQQRTAEAVDLLKVIANHPASSVGARALAAQILAAQDAQSLASAGLYESSFTLAAVLAAL